MKLVKTSEGLAEDVPSIALAAGFFDGVHLGHRGILSATLDRARAIGGEAWALTFEPHPLAIIAPERRPKLLTSLDLRLELLSAAGLDGCMLLPFTTETAALTPAQFVQKLLGGWMERGRTCTVASGDNWRFGGNRAGKLADIETLSGGDISVLEVPIVMYGGSRVSSSRIREAICAGKLQDAAAMLGRPHMIRERTAIGTGEGAKLGFATANITPRAEVMPPVGGVYEVAVSRLSHKEDGWMKGVANYGFRPTFPNARPDVALLEVHILDFRGDLHGEALDVVFIRKLRDEVKFKTRGELIRQMKADVQAVREGVGFLGHSKS